MIVNGLSCSLTSTQKLVISHFIVDSMARTVYVLRIKLEQRISFVQ